MALRMVFDLAYLSIAKSRIEPGRLKAVRAKKELLTTAANGLFFSRLQEARAESATPVAFIDPEVRDFGAASPTVTADARDDFAVTQYSHSQQPAVKVARRFGVELINTVDEKRVQ